MITSAVWPSLNQPVGYVSPNYSSPSQNIAGFCVDTSAGNHIGSFKAFHDAASNRDTVFHFAESTVGTVRGGFFHFHTVRCGAIRFGQNR